MKLYRAIEFSKLQYLCNSATSLLWIDTELKTLTDKHVNWWLDNQNQNVRRQIVSSICKNSHDNFFNLSVEYNSIFGGRFNPSRSFGMLYTSNSFFVANLEVLYHQFADNYKLYLSLEKKKHQFQTTFNLDVPKQIDVLVVVFELSVDDVSIYKLNENDDDLKDLCVQLGFENYVNEKFNREFVFGNDYEISNIVGCFFHSNKNKDGLSCPSARVSFESQDQMQKKVRNIIFPKKSIRKLNASLTGNFYECRSTIQLGKNDDGLHDVNVNISGAKNMNLDFYLQPTPERKKGPKDQIVGFEPTLEHDLQGKLREVLIQKFIREQMK